MRRASGVPGRGSFQQDAGWAGNVSCAASTGCCGGMHEPAAMPGPAGVPDPAAVPACAAAALCLCTAVSAGPAPHLVLATMVSSALAASALRPPWWSCIVLMENCGQGGVPSGKAEGSEGGMRWHAAGASQHAGAHDGTCRDRAALRSPERAEYIIRPQASLPLWHTPGPSPAPCPHPIAQVNDLQRAVGAACDELPGPQVQACDAVHAVEHDARAQRGAAAVCIHGNFGFVARNSEHLVVVAP